MLLVLYDLHCIFRENSTFPNQSSGQRLTTRGGGEGRRTSQRRVWSSPTTPEWSIADPDVLGTEFYSISASKRRTNAVKYIWWTNRARRRRAKVGIDYTSVSPERLRR